MYIKGIVFDKDGTLFDFNATWGAWTKAMLAEEAEDAKTLARLAAALGYDLETEKFYPGSIVIAETTDAIADRVLTVIPGQDKPALIARMIAKAQTVPQVPAANLPALVARLVGLGHTLGVVTNDNEATAFVHLDRAGILGAFRTVIGADSGFGAKPSPLPLLGFCKSNGLNPADCLMVGDSLHDLQAGAAAGMIPVGVLTGPATRETLAPFAKVVLPSIADLPDWIAAKA